MQRGQAELSDYGISNDPEQLAPTGQTSHFCIRRNKWTVQNEESSASLLDYGPADPHGGYAAAEGPHSKAAKQLLHAKDGPVVQTAQI
jgi:hypothetical protein